MTNLLYLVLELILRRAKLVRLAKDRTRGRLGSLTITSSYLATIERVHGQWWDLIDAIVLGYIRIQAYSLAFTLMRNSRSMPFCERNISALVLG